MSDHLTYYKEDGDGDWGVVAERLGALAETVRTEERERIALAIEALPESDGAGWPNRAYEIKADAASIARGGDDA